MLVNGLKLSFYYHDEKKRKQIRRHVTAVLINPDDGVTVGYGESVCNESDNFNRAIGRKIALARAINHLPRGERSKIWEDFKSSGIKYTR